MKFQIMYLGEIKNIGFIGLGVMGSPMCKNLLKNTHWNIFVKDLDKLKEKDLAPSEMGKGRNVWYCLGMCIARDEARSVAPSRL